LFEPLDDIRAKLDALRPFSVDLEKKIDHALEARFVASSNQVEDKDALSLVETEVYFESDLTSAGRRVDDFLALGRHRDALADVRAKARAGAPLTLDLIRGLHQTLTRDSKDKDRTPGEWRSRTGRATARRGRSIRYAAPEEVPSLMRDLVALFDGLVSQIHPVHAVATFSYHFHLIHPFNDSNGRVQRLVASFLLLKWGFRELIVDPIERSEYIGAITACDSTVPADKLAPLYPGIETGALAEFFGVCVERTLDEVQGIIEGRIPLTTADVGKASKRDQTAFMARLRQASPQIAWREEAQNEVRALHERVAASLQAGAQEGPLYSIECTTTELRNDHAVDPLLRPSLPAGGAGVVGQTSLTIRPKPTAAVKMPKPRVLLVAVVATKMGLHLVSRWEDETKPTLRHGTGKAAEWSQASVERYLVQRLDKARVAYDAEIVELNRVKDLKAALKAVTQKKVKGSNVRGIRASEPPVEL
jgi:hypothetical protein